MGNLLSNSTIIVKITIGTGYFRIVVFITRFHRYPQVSSLGLRHISLDFAAELRQDELSVLDR